MRFGKFFPVYRKEITEEKREWHDFYLKWPKFVIDEKSNRYVLCWRETVERRWYSNIIEADKSGWIYRLK